MRFGCKRCLVLWRKKSKVGGRWGNFMIEKIENQPILTISILISNNYDNVKRCLESVKPLLNSLPSELILTDTGVEPRLRKLLEEYTDHIIDFLWCQDFSAARNVGLKEAKGQWFLYIDDDEWYEDTTDISHFLQSEEANDYNVACYIQRNYLEFDGKQYVDNVVDRILRINPDLHFEHRIHEAYTGIEFHKKKILNAIAYHYGYCYQSEEQMMEKHMRNQTLLELECKEHPDDMRMRYQMVINPYTIKDWDASIQYALEVIDIQSNSQYWDACHTSILYCMEKKGDWKNLIEYGERFLEKPLFPYYRFGIMQFMIDAFWETEQLGRLCDMAELAVELYQKYTEEPDIFNQNQLMQTTFVEKNYMLYFLLYSITAALIEKRESLAQKLRTSATADMVDEILNSENTAKWIQKQLDERQSTTHNNGEDCLRERYVKLIRMATEIVWLYRKQFFYHGMNLLSDFLQVLQKEYDLAEQNNIEPVLDRYILSKIMEAQEMQDDILVADYIEGLVIPALQDKVQQIEQKVAISDINYLEANCKVLRKTGRYEDLIQKVMALEEQMSGGDVQSCVEFTASGEITLKHYDGEKIFYLCGNNNPYRDALGYADANREDGYSQYVICGSCLFYDAEVMLKSRGDIDLYIIEEKLEDLYYALRYRNLTDILDNERLHIINEPYWKSIGDVDEKTQKLLIKQAAIREIKDTFIRQRVASLFVKVMSIQEQGDLLVANFRKNMQGDIHSIDEVSQMFFDKEVYLVAGGPSLDKSMHYLKNRKKDTVVLCVGTAVAKLIGEGIVPDFVIITDAKDEILRQMYGIPEESRIKLLYLSSANFKAVSFFKGDRYVIFQQDFELAEKYAQQYGFTLFKTGGSVSTTALDVLLRFHANRIICLGLDLAYTNGKSHASDTFAEHELYSTNYVPKIKSTAGKEIPTVNNLLSYHYWIEERIRDVDNIELINISDGAYISGMKNISPSLNGEVVL